jgi:small ligand-binding sensory domain FIST
MPRVATLLVAVVLGCAVFALFAFTVIGLVGEAVVALALLGLIARALVGATHRLRGQGALTLLAAGASLVRDSGDWEQGRATCGCLVGRGAG